METISEVSVLEDEQFESVVKRVDLVCITDWDEKGIVSTFNSIQFIHEILLVLIRFA